MMTKVTLTLDADLLNELRDFMRFPSAVKEDMGNGLGIAQFGGTAPTAKP